MLDLLGEYDCKMDAKGRFMLPSGLKKQMADVAHQGFVINRDVFRPCLSLYPKPEWENTMKMVRRLNRFVEKNMEFIRRFTSGATPLELDPAGRLLMPKPLMSHAGKSRELKLIGIGDRVEVWGKEAYLSMLREQVDLTALAEDVMGSLGNEDGQ